MSIGPINFVSPTPLGSAGGLSPVGTGLAPAEKANLGAGEAFGAALAGHLDRVQGAQRATDTAAVQAATGDLNDIHDYMIKSAQSGIMTDLTVAVRNKAVEAFTEIMRMQA